MGWAKLDLGKPAIGEATDATSDHAAEQQDDDCDEQPRAIANGNVDKGPLGMFDSLKAERVHLALRRKTWL